MNLRLVKSQLEQVQQEASTLQLQLTSVQDEGNSAKQEVSIVTIHCSLKNGVSFCHKYVGDKILDAETLL